MWYCCRLWPSCDAPEPWQGVVRQLYGHLPSRKLLWTAADGGRWLSTQQCLFPDAACMQRDPQGLVSGSEAGASFSSKQSGQQGRGTSSTVGSGSEGEDGGEGFGPLGEALVQLGVPLAVLPSSVLRMMLKYLVRSRTGYSCDLKTLATRRGLNRMLAALSPLHQHTQCMCAVWQTGSACCCGSHCSLCISLFLT